MSVIIKFDIDKLFLNKSDITYLDAFQELRRDVFLCSFRNLKIYNKAQAFPISIANKHLSRISR